MTATITRTRSLWRNPNFVRLWLSETISSFGSQFSGLAIPLTAIYVLHSSSNVPFIAAAGTVPFLLFGLYVGVWVDRHRKRPLMVSVNLGRSLLLGSIPIAFLLGRLNIPLLYLTSFLVGTLQVFYDIAYQAYLPALVERDQLVEGNSKLEGSRSTTQIIGNAVAGGVISIVSAPLAIAADSIGFLASALSLSGIKKEETGIETSAASVISDIREGLAAVFGDRRLRSIAGTTATTNFFSNALLPVALVYLADKELASKGLGFGFDAYILGIVFSVGGVGGILGAVFSGRIARLIGVGRAIVFSAFIFGIATFTYYIVTPSMSNPVFSIAGFTLTLAMLILILGQFSISFASLVYNVNQVSLRQAIVAIRLQGRMNATMRFLVWGTLPLGAVAGGILLVVIGLRPTILVTAAGGTLAFLWVLLSPVRSLKEIPEPMS